MSCSSGIVSLNLVMTLNFAIIIISYLQPNCCKINDQFMVYKLVTKFPNVYTHQHAHPYLMYPLPTSTVCHEKVIVDQR